MPFEGWMQYAGTELANVARTAVYAGQAGIPVSCTGCRDLRASLGDPPYTDAATDRAPWYDPAVAESTRFYGMVPLELTGASDSTAERHVTEFLGDGGMLGPSRAATREIEVKAVLVASSRTALSYGLGWLDTALAGSVCGTGCGGDSLCVYAACPERPLLGAPGDDCGHPGDGTPDPDWDPVAAGDQLLRQLHNVARTDGPTLEKITHLGPAWYGEISVTLAAGNPWWWRMPRFVLNEATEPDYTDQVPNYQVIPDEPCPAPPDCMATNPYCTGNNRPWPDEPFPGSDPHDTTLIDPCYPTSPFTARRALWRVPSSAMLEWNATAPIMRITTGKAPLRRVTLRWYTNPRNQRPTGGLDPCDACSEMTIPWIPDRTTLTIDSRTRSITVDCRGQGATSSTTTVYGPRGGAYQWPAFDCATPLVVELVALDSALTPDVSWRLDLAGRVGAI